MTRGDRSDVIVIGAGLAGASCAHALGRRGLLVRLVEGAPTIASKASGNRFALVTPYITSRSSPLETIYSAGFDFSLNVLSTTIDSDSLFTQCGSLQLPSTERLANTLQDEAPLLGAFNIQRVTPSEASAIAGIDLSFPAFYVANAGYLNPAAFIRALLSASSTPISLSTGARVVSLARKDGSWTLTLSDGEKLTSSAVVICGAYESSILEQSSWLPLEPIRGQTIQVSAHAPTVSLRAVLNFGGYVVPAVAGEHLIGAHYRHNDSDESVSRGDTCEILETCHKWAPSLHLSESKVTGARVCFRTSTVDRLPYIGRLPAFDEMKHEASCYQSGTELRNVVPMRLHEGLYIHAGHGSRGMLSCPIGGEIIARLICAEPLASLEATASLCCPTRLPYRLLSRSH